MLRLEGDYSGIGGDKWQSMHSRRKQKARSVIFLDGRNKQESDVARKGFAGQRFGEKVWRGFDN